MQGNVIGRSTASVKDSIRNERIGRRMLLSKDELRAKSSSVEEFFISMPEYVEARKLALYSSFRNEVITEGVFADAVGSGKEVYYPRVVRSGPHLAFFRVMDESELVKGSYEILEPPHGAAECHAAEFDCIVVPGAAFDEKGARIGYGRGYYDRALKHAKCPVVGFAFECQMTDGVIETEPHDVRVSVIVTEKRVIRV